VLVRLNKRLADLGHASRRGAEALIASGRVRVNGKVVTDLSTRVDAQTDKIEVSAQEASGEGGYLLNKPAGYVTTKSDGEGRNILQLLPPDAAHMSHAGRLDKESRGLVLMLADGRLSYAITAPETHLDKEYEVEVEPEATGSQVEKMRKGLTIDGRATQPAEVTGKRKGRERALRGILNITLVEGRKHQIRKMCKKVGLKVLDLKRVRIGPVKMGGMEEGKWRKLSQAELKALAAQVEKAKPA
jgi:pseudouridine synthase